MGQVLAASGSSNVYRAGPTPGGVALSAQTVGGLRPYIEDSPTDPLSPQSISPVGGSQPHTNFQPYLCVDFIISLFGIFPSPT